MFTKVFIKRPNMAGKETIYYKIWLGLKHKFLWRPVKLNIDLKAVFNNSENRFTKKCLISLLKPQLLKNMDPARMAKLLCRAVALHMQGTTKKACDSRAGVERPESEEVEVQKAWRHEGTDLTRELHFSVRIMNWMRLYSGSVSFNMPWCCLTTGEIINSI